MWIQAFLLFLRMHFSLTNTALIIANYLLCGTQSHSKDDFPGVDISIIKHRWPHDRLVFIMGFLILARRHTCPYGNQGHNFLWRIYVSRMVSVSYIAIASYLISCYIFRKIFETMCFSPECNYSFLRAGDLFWVDAFLETYIHIHGRDTDDGRFAPKCSLSL